MAKIPYRNCAAREISLNQSDPSCDTSAWNLRACSSDMSTSRVVVSRIVSSFLRLVRRETKSNIFILKVLSCKHGHIICLIVMPPARGHPRADLGDRP